MKNYKIMISRMVRAVKMCVLGGMVAMTCSCEDFLTISPTDRIVQEDFWKTKGDVENVVAESYRLMTTKDFLYRLLVWGELRSDNVIEGNYGGNNDIKYIMEANLLPNNSYAQWDVFYKIINNCNIVLKYAPGVLNEDPNFSEGDLDVVKGEMYALRALCHFYLVRTFRDVPLLTEAMVNNSQNLMQPQAEPLVVLDSCLNDLYRAEEWVLTSGNYLSISNNKGRITKDAVRTMIADVLLWKAAFLKSEKKTNEAQACYKQCIQYCDQVLDVRMKYMKDYLEDAPKYYDSRDMALHSTYPILYPKDDALKSGKRFPCSIYDESFGLSANNLCESIFEIQHTSLASNANRVVPEFYGYGKDPGYEDFNVGLLSASADLALEKKEDTKIYQKSDFRRVTYVNSQKSSTGNAPENYAIIKYSQMGQIEERSTDLSDNDVFGDIVYTYFPTNTSDGRYIDAYVNWIVYRIADVMLMKAEALAYCGGAADLAEAYALVEAVYNRSQAKGADGMVKTNVLANHYPFANYGTSAAMVGLVLEERQRELAFEGKRWYDLVRKALCDGSTSAMLDIMIPRKYESNPAAYRVKMVNMYSLFFPIAEREINTNDLLTQNPVYETVNLFE